MSKYKFNPFTLELDESQASVCLAANVQNSDASYSNSVASGGSLTLPDSDIEVNNTIEGQVVSVKTVEINLKDSAATQVSPTLTTINSNVIDLELPDVTVDNSNTSFQVNVPAGGSLTLPDNEYYVNGVYQFNFPGLNVSDITITDGTNPVTPTSITQGISFANEIIIEVPAAVNRSTAQLMKTGQTVSQQTGDDGDIEAGRNVSFFVLAENNPFGNTNRFTSTTGNQTYTNTIIIDWATYDGSTVLGWSNTVRGGGITTWSQDIAAALVLNIGGYSSGWRIPNINEMMSIPNYSYTFNYIQYAPFNLGGFALSTSTRQTATEVFKYASASGGIVAVGRFSQYNNYIVCRTFTVTGTTLS
jgi:hypothetical protein